MSDSRPLPRAGIPLDGRPGCSLAPLDGVTGPGMRPGSSSTRYTGTTSRASSSSASGRATPAAGGSRARCRLLPRRLAALGHALLPVESLLSRTEDRGPGCRLVNDLDDRAFGAFGGSQIELCVRLA